MKSAGLALALLVLSPGASSYGSTLVHPSARQLEEVAALVEKHYLRAIPHDSLAAAARRCFEGTLDRYTAYLDSAEAVNFEREIAGRFGGIGVTIASDSVTGMFRIRGVLANSPALRAGVIAGDTLVAVEGFTLRGQDYWDVIGRIRGLVGSSIQLSIRPAGAVGERRFTLRRAVVESPTVRPLRIGASDVERYLVDPRTRVAYLRIERFSERTAVDLERALAVLRRVGARALVLDLRDNGGGVMRSAIQVADQFLDSGTIVTTRTRGEPDQVKRAQRGELTRLPMAVLVNANTASAAEVLAASLQDNRRAIVVGTRSFGKGVVLNLFPLRRTPGLLKLTTTSYVRPSGGPMERHIPFLGSERGGVWPDSGMAVTLTEDEERRWSDAVFETTLRMREVGATPETSPPPDRVLERAVAALGEALSD